MPSGVPNNNATFFYRFVANKPGTYWIHSHDPGQYPKGLRTPFVVTNNAIDSKTYGYENDYAASVSDWFVITHPATQGTLLTGSQVLKLLAFGKELLGYSSEP